MTTNLSFGQLHWLDILTITIYIAVLLGTGFYTICRTKKDLKNMFLAGRSLSWIPIGMSMFGSNIGCTHFVGIAGSAAVSGLAVILLEWCTVYLIILLGWVYLPVYMASGIYTIPEYLHKRFGGQRLRIFLSVISLLNYSLSNLTAELYSGALFIKQTTGWNIYIGVAVILSITISLTSLGGLKTVVFTDTLAVLVMLSGGLLVSILSLIHIGGFKQLYIKYNEAIPNVTLPNTTCGYPSKEAWHIFQDSILADYPGLGTFIRSTIGALWYWCSNQMVVQSSLAAKNIKHAKAGCILCAYLKLTPMILIVIPGMVSRALFPDEVACATSETCNDICGNPDGCSNIAYPKLALEVLPNGLRGLVIAAMISAVISSLSSLFNGSSSLISIDIWTKVRPNATEKEQLIVGKMFLIILLIFAVSWMPVMQSAAGGQLFRYEILTSGLVTAPFAGLFLIAVFVSRINENGAFWGLVIGQLWGLWRFILETIYPASACLEIDTRPLFLRYYHVFYHILSQIVLTIIVAFVISFLTKPIEKYKLAGTLFWNRFDKKLDNFKLDINIDYQTFSLDKENIIEAKNDDNHDKIVKNGSIDHCNSHTTTNNNKSVTTLFNLCCKGNEEFTKSLDNSAGLECLEQSTLWTVFLNFNGFVIVTIVTVLFIYLH